MNRSDVKDKAAYDKIIKARTILVIDQPFFGALALHLELVECPDGKGKNETMWVNGTHMGYYPAFVHKCSAEELQAVLAHEVLHCCYKHFTRKQHRNHVIFNWAGDYIINDDLKKANFKLPVPHLWDEKYAKMSTEEVYEKLKQEVKGKLKKQGQQGKGQKGKQKGQGSGQGEGNDGEGDDGEGEVTILPDTDLDMGPECWGEVRDANGSKPQQGQTERDWEASVRMAVNVAKRANAGNIPGFLERLVTAIAEPRVSWRELTRQFIDNSMTKDYSWARPNRRMIDRGLYLPGFISDSLQHMVFAVDTSGSINAEMLQAFTNEIGGALNDGTADKLTIVYADTRVAHVDEYMQGDIVQCKMHGGGGTAFGDTFRWIKENAPDAQCIVYLTDMMTGEWGEDIGIPTMWACYLPARMLAQVHPPFGTMIAVDSSE
jgi:predicted metal-dependent peptidase